MAFELRSPAFVNGGQIPAEYTCEGDGTSPALAWSDPPPGTRSYVLIVHDPDAPRGDFTHWLVYQIPADVHTLSKGASRDLPYPQGANSADHIGWVSPCPPKGHGPHRYVFDLYALNADNLQRDPGAGQENIEGQMTGHVLGKAELTGRFERKG